MVTKPARACASHRLAPGVVALPGGFALLEPSRALLCADAHLGYEDVIGGGSGLPLWSTAETIAAIGVAVRRHAAREVIFLGDAIHGSALSEGAARAVAAAIGALRAEIAVTVVAGNHEGRSRGVAVLGETVEGCERHGWTLVHGDRPIRSWRGAGTIVGHLHPSMHLGGEATVPAFLAGSRLVVVPALTPYSPGLDVLGDPCAAALAAWNAEPRDVQVVAATDDRVYPFGSLAALRAALHGSAPGPEPLGRRRRLVSDVR